MTTRDTEIRLNARRHNISISEAAADWDAKEAFFQQIQNYTGMFSRVQEANAA
ncbi:hypothetical protein [Arthrobacter sp. MDT1-65]